MCSSKWAVYPWIIRPRLTSHIRPAHPSCMSYWLFPPVSQKMLPLTRAKPNESGRPVRLRQKNPFGVKRQKTTKGDICRQKAADFAPSRPERSAGVPPAPRLETMSASKHPAFSRRGLRSNSGLAQGHLEIKKTRICVLKRVYLSLTEPKCVYLCLSSTLKPGHGPSAAQYEIRTTHSLRA
jgi:hypothetical protein